MGLFKRECAIVKHPVATMVTKLTHTDSGMSIKFVYQCTGCASKNANCY